MLFYSLETKELWAKARKASRGDKPVEQHLLCKYPLIVITNACNLACGGCTQLCGQFSKDKLWFITLDELRKNIEIIGRHMYYSFIGIFGGEPTLHPDFHKIIQILTDEFPQYRFMVFTNGRVPTFNRKNVCFNVDPKPGTKQYHYPTLIAAQDILGVEDRSFYWAKAQKDCYLWKKCGVGIYRDKAYFCEMAGAMDQLTGENHGWEMNSEPFNKTPEEIAEQASHFCYRCGFCAATGRKKMPDGVPLQTWDMPYLVSETNAGIVRDKPGLNQLVQLELPCHK